MAKNLIIGILLVFAFFSNSNLLSQVPTAPINLSTEITYEDGNYVLLLTWQNDNEYLLTDFFNIYLATGTTEDPLDFSLSSTITRDGDQLTIYSYSHTFTDVDYYSLYITGENIEGEGPASEFMHFIAGPTINFLSIPGEADLKSVVDIVYNFDVDAEASDEGSVTFSLQEPSILGMSIGASSGTLTWTPNMTGLYNVTVIAQHVDEPIVQETLSWQILVRSCEEPTYLTGYVYDQYEEAIENANISIKSLSPIDTTVYYYATTDENGYFSVEVLEGSYVIFAEGENFLSEWYANREFEFDADIVEILCGKTKEITFDVESFEFHTISGYVTDENTGYPVYPGIVRIIELYQDNVNNIYEVMTGNDGYYSIELNNRFKYKILACDDYTPKRFIPMYYNNSYDYLEAQYLIVGNEDIENVNFVLKEYPVYLNAISGKVRDNFGSGVSAMLVLYKHQEIAGVRTIDSDENGNFTFRNLEPGKYIVRAIPYGNYTSGFYHITEEVIPHWFDATFINVDDNTEFINHLMVVRAMPYPEGEFNIYGGVFVNQNGIEVKGEKTQANVSIQGALVYLLNSKNTVVAQRISNQSGGFSFRDITSDHYTIKVDKIGYQYFTSDDVYVNEIDKSLAVALYLDKHPHTNPTISFKTNPVTEANVGELYSYDADATTNSIDSVKYALIESPIGMTVNPSTGLINWTPESSGTYSVTLEAYLKNNPAVNIRQTWSIEVIESEGTAWLSVLVKQGETIYQDATLNLYASDFSNTYTLTTNAEGLALFAVPNGDYYLHIMGDEFEDCWYNNKTDFDDAEMLNLTPGDTLEIEASVTLKIISYKISGVVTDNNSEGIEEASVHFILTSGEIRTVVTDAEGKFTFELGKDTSYRAMAVKDGHYNAQYYPSLFDFAETMSIMSANKNDLNFTLEQLPKSTVNIQGTILDESALPVPGVVIAYRGEDVDDGTSLKFSVDYVNSTATHEGNYNLVVPISGNYIIRAYPADMNYYPAYFSEEAEAVYTWLDAKKIEATGGTIEDVFIKTEKVTPTSGTGSINGNISIAYFGFDVNFEQMKGQGFTVFAFDQQDKICKFTYSGTSHKFNLSNLALTQWRVSSEKVGLFDYDATQNVTLSQGNTSEEVFLMYLGGGSVDEDAEKIMTIYPNPAGNIINITFKNDNIFNSSVTILDNLGNERMKFERNAGIISIDISSLNTGAYYIRVATGLKNYTMPFVKIR